VTTTPEPSDATYLLDNALDHARERLSAGAEWLDPWTVSRLQLLGVGSGWTCLEVGAGAGSIADWLCERVGPTGHVLATDIDPRFAHRPGRPNLEVRVHDIRADELPARAFDVVHARLLLSHLADPDAALTKLVAALKPGGWLLVEDFDHLTCGHVDPMEAPERARVYQALWAADLRFMSEHGVQLDLGRRLFRMFRAHGLTTVTAEGFANVSSGGSAYARFLYLGWLPFREAYGSMGVTKVEMDQFLELLRDPEFVMLSHLLIAVSGQRPSM
jgi:ubiquinone/menaquinone biosynthesis C-methylase UbiE